MHRGIDDEGKHLYPAFPYPWFTKLSRADVDAIKAYLNTLQPVSNDVKKPDLPWPLSVRTSVAAWNALFLKEGEFKADPGKSAQWNRGAYLVEGAGHCAACHSPKNVLGGVKNDESLEGGQAGEHWYAPSLTGNLRDGLGGWTTAEIVEYLKTGSNAKSAAAGSMKDVIQYSTQHLTQADLTSIAVYLKDLPGDDATTSTAQAAHASNAGDGDRAWMTRGEAIYVDNCTGCHMQDGGGMRGVFPPLRGSAAIVADKPDTVIHVVVEGQQMVQTQDKPTGLSMPAFAGKLTDGDIADVVSYIRNAWSNYASTVDAAAVAAVREIAKPIGAGQGKNLARSDATLRPRQP